MFQVDGRPDLSGGKRRARPPNEGRKTYDEARMRFVEAEGYLVVRFWNGGAFAHLDGVLSTSAETIQKRSTPQEWSNRRLVACGDCRAKTPDGSHPVAAFHAGGASERVTFGAGHLLSQKKAREATSYGVPGKQPGLAGEDALRLPIATVLVGA